MNADIWGPHYWFVLHTISMNYPINPNKVTKKKYYEFIQNVPLFLPDQKMGDHMLVLLDKYPVMPYLDSRESFVKWMHFFHNKINEHLDKPYVDFETFTENYYKNYKPLREIHEENNKHREQIVYLLIVAILIGIIVYLYKK